MAQNDKIIRLVRLILLINVHPGLSAKELAKRNGISMRQFFRDLETLCCAGVPLFNDHGYRLIEKLGLKKLSLTLEEAMALIYAIKLMEKSRGPIRAGTEIRKKLLELLPDQLRTEVESLQNQVEIADHTVIDYSTINDFFKKLNEAIRVQRRLVMDYYSFSSNKLTTRTVEPYQLIFQDNFWYLVAYCYLREEVRLFRVDRIRKLELTEEYFSKPVDFDFQTYLGSAWQMERGEEYTFRLRFWSNAARYIRETQFHPSQEIQEEKDSTILFTAQACGLKSIARWVLQFGSEVEVLEPVELREMVVKQLQTALQKC